MRRLDMLVAVADDPAALFEDTRALSVRHVKVSWLRSAWTQRCSSRSELGVFLGVGAVRGSAGGQRGLRQRLCGHRGASARRQMVNIAWIVWKLEAVPCERLLETRC